MDGTQALMSGTASESSGLEPSCPRCGEPFGGLRSVETSLFDGVALRRCPRCSSRFAVDEAESRPVATCRSCGIPYLPGQRLHPLDPECPDCRTGNSDELGRAEIEATEAEVRLALADDWTFVSAPSLGIYLNRVVRELARRMPGAPAGARVALFDSPALESLALSRTLLVSVGTLADLKDEAELAFVLGHELAHASAGVAG